MTMKLIILKLVKGHYEYCEDKINKLLGVLKDHISSPPQYIFNGEDIVVLIHYEEEGFSSTGKKNISDIISDFRNHK